MDDRASGVESDLPHLQPKPNERRKEARVRLDLELAVPVSVSTGSSEYRGVARNISEGGMLVELPIAPAIGARVKVRFAGVQGSAAAPDSVELSGEVRHHMAWQFNKDGATSSMRGIGIRFTDPDEVPSAPLNSWVWRTGHTIH